MIRFERFEENHQNDVLTLWNSEFEASYPLTPRLLRQNALEDGRLFRAGSWIARSTDKGEPVGFVIVKKALEDDGRFGLGTELGWIHALLVAREWRGRGVGGTLLRQAEEALALAGVRRIQLGNDLHRRMFPGVPDESGEAKSWFERRGYVYREEAYDLIKSYSPEERTDLPDPGEATLRIAVPQDREALNAFMARCFPGTWDLQLRDYWEQGGTGREYVLLEKKGVLIGFCRINTSESPLLGQNVYWAPLFREALGGIGPLGIDEKHRGSRYGISIVQAAIHFLRGRGIGRMVIDTTPFVEFYGKLGYETWKKYAKYEKNL
ncbi:GNAT family N-acetyltransferase [Paenibacillaceae bacterium WGS1546]|uniref:GNAT family N-acetyltransferase n=1 Tax=Cohnella sp. WGS1546 TaxID=3366810 RepID=UPI00372D0427